MAVERHPIAAPRAGAAEVRSGPCGGRHTREDPHVHGASVPFGPWGAGSADFRRHGKAGDAADGRLPA